MKNSSSYPATLDWAAVGKWCFLARDIPSDARFLYYSTLFIGLPILVSSILQAASAEPTWLFLALATITTSLFPIRLPSLDPKSQVSLTVTASDIFVFASLLLFSPQVAVVMASIDCLVGIRRTATPHRIFFNLGLVSVITFTVGHIFQALCGTLPNSAVDDGLSIQFFYKVVFCAALYLAGNTAAIARIMSLSAKRPFLKVWEESFLWSSLINITGISVVATILCNFGRVQFLGIGVALPIVIIMFYAYRMNHQRVESLQKAVALAHYDPLTGLANRKLFHDRLEAELDNARSAGRSVALLLFDLDNFKRVNDSLGHAAGDSLLQDVARRLEAGLGNSETVTRLGGDEFMVILPGLKAGRSLEASQTAEGILRCFEEPFTVRNRQLLITASVGISLFPADGQDPEMLVKNADMAMYRAKNTGGNRYRFYSAELSDQSNERLSLEVDLRNAVEGDDLQVHYQPQIDLATGRMTGVEALVRWRPAQRGWIPPSVFIPIAEESDLIFKVGAQVLRKACMHGCKWRDAAGTELRIAVNLSILQLTTAGLVEMVDEVLKETGLPPHCLELELTESMLMENVDQILDVLRSLKNRGIQLAIDDFGTGYSSLAYLKKLCIDRLKIDRSFVRDIKGDDSPDAKITRSIISMGHHLNLSVLAEGVETQAQLGFLQIHGCDEMQGFIFSRPVPADRIEQMAVSDSRLTLADFAHRKRAVSA